jgi:hypothetical protein
LILSGQIGFSVRDLNKICWSYNKTNIRLKQKKKMVSTLS